MKVALVLDGIGAGGIERVAIQYAKMFIDLEYEVDIYNLKPKANGLEKEFPEACKFYYKKVSDYLLPDRYMLLVKRWRWGKYVYPIVYLGTLLAMYAYRLTMKKRKKYDIGIAFSGHFRDLSFVAYNFILCEKKMCWLHGSLMSYLILSSTFGDLYRKIKNLCILSTDNEIAAMDANRFLNGLNINKIYNPISYQKKELDIQVVNDNKNRYGEYLLMIGRFDQDKDQKTVIYAMKDLVDNYGIQENLVLIGEGSTLEECKKLVKKLSLEERVFFTGVRYDVQNYYSTAKLFIHSSKLEGLPTVLLEAMKYGVPIVATNSKPGVPEILKNSEYGEICEVGDASGMAKSIFDMLSDEEKMRMYREKGTERLRDFEYENIKKQLEKIIGHLQ